MEKRVFPKMNQNERNAFKVKITEEVKAMVLDGANDLEDGIIIEEVIDVKGGFIIVTPKGYVFVSCVVKGEKFDLEDAVMELEDQVARAIEKEKAKAEKLAKEKAKKDKAKG